MGPRITTKLKLTPQDASVPGEMTNGPGGCTRGHFYAASICCAGMRALYATGGLGLAVSARRLAGSIAPKEEVNIHSRRRPA